MRKKYVMFGHNNLLGDFIEIIHHNNGILTKIVQNIPEPIYPNRPTLKERLANLKSHLNNPKNINHGFPVEICQLKDFVPEEEEYYLIGFPGFQMQPLVQEIKAKFQLKFTTIIHPTAIISATAQIGEGVIINAGTIIASGVKIHDHVAINKGVIIGHDTEIKRYSVIQPGVKIGGHVVVNVGATLGIGSVVIEDIVIGEYSLIAAGAVVIKDVPSNTLVAGVPAVHKKNINQCI